MASQNSVNVGGVKIGGGAPVSIQSMCTADPADPGAVASQVMDLAGAGCDLIRIAVPAIEHVEAVREVRRLTRGVPLIADVHFDHRVAVRLCGVVDKIRLNPGTMHRPEAMREVARALIDTKTPIRIGTNSGSLPDDLRGPGIDPAHALVEAAARWIDDLRELGVQDIVVSVKSSSPEVTIKACELAAARFDHPLHIGVTEAGTAWSGAIRSATVMGALLARGIGDTIRVSLAGPPLPEVRAATEILAALGMRSPGIQVRACPGCGRARMDTGIIAEQIEHELAGIRGPSAVVAIMGCEVNGPGEAAGARWTLVGTKAGAAFYRDGTMVENGPVDMEVAALIKEVRAGSAETGSRT